MLLVFSLFFLMLEYGQKQECDCVKFSHLSAVLTFGLFYSVICTDVMAMCLDPNLYTIIYISPM